MNRHFEGAWKRLSLKPLRPVCKLYLRKCARPCLVVTGICLLIFLTFLTKLVQKRHINDVQNNVNILENSQTFNINSSVNNYQFENLNVPHVQKQSTTSWPNTTSYMMPVTYLCINSIGRIGNQLFAYASLIGVAKRKRMTPSFFEANAFIFRYFKHPTAIKKNNECAQNVKVINKKHCAFSGDDLSFSNKLNTSMFGYFQSWLYFENSLDDLHRELAFTDDVRESAQRSIRKAVSNFSTSSNLTYITIHVRRSDILESQNFVNYGFLSPGRKYYLKAMQLFRRTYANAVFIVCSDRIAWCKTHLNFSDVVFIEGNNAVVDLCVLSQGNHTIMSVGTYGWWGAFLANGTTVAYKYPAKEGTTYLKHFSSDLKDYFLPHWIIMDDI